MQKITARSWLTRIIVNAGAFLLLVVLVLLSSCTPSPGTPGPTIPIQPSPTPRPSAEETEPSSPAEYSPYTGLGGCLPTYSEPDEFLQLRPGTDLWGSAAADFNGDGWPDIVLYRGRFQTGEDYEIDVLLNDGAGNLYQGTSELFPSGTPRVVEPRELVLADFNGDGVMDMFFADQGMDTDPWPGAQNTLVLSAPGGTMFDASDRLPQQSDQTHSAAAADIDGDGDVDLWIGNLGGGGVGAQLLLNDGQGHFSVADDRLPAVHFDFDSNWYTTSAFADLNNDGSPDLILGQGNANRDSHVLLNDGAGYFSDVSEPLPPTIYAPQQQPVDIKSGDLNGDGLLDLVISDTRHSYSGNFIQVLIGNGDGTFEDRTDSWLPQSVNSQIWSVWLNLIDLDGDGDLDLVESLMGGWEPRFYLNSGASFSRIANEFNIYIDILFTFIDVDRDGLLDAFWSYPACGDVSCPETHFIVRASGCP